MGNFGGPGGPCAPASEAATRTIANQPGAIHRLGFTRDNSGRTWVTPEDGTRFRPRNSSESPGGVGILSIPTDLASPSRSPWAPSDHSTPAQKPGLTGPDRTEYLHDRGGRRGVDRSPGDDGGAVVKLGLFLLDPEIRERVPLSHQPCRESGFVFSRDLRRGLISSFPDLGGWRATGFVFYSDRSDGPAFALSGQTPPGKRAISRRNRRVSCLQNDRSGRALRRRGRHRESSNGCVESSTRRRRRSIRKSELPDSKPAPSTIQNRVRTSEAFWPPNPKLLEMAVLTGISRAVLGT